MTQKALENILWLHLGVPFILPAMKNMAWTLESEYPSCQSSEYQADFDAVLGKIASLEQLISSLHGELVQAKNLARDPGTATIEVVQKVLMEKEATTVLLVNLSVYLSCILSVDSSEETARRKQSELQMLASRFSQVLIPLENFLTSSSDNYLQKILAHPEIKPSEFLWSEQRKLKSVLLGDNEETLLEAVSQPGFRAWGDLYSKLSGSIRCHLKYPDRTETVGLAQASALTRNQDEAIRKMAWYSIQEAWSEHKETAAAILNSLSGWRHEVNRKRSHTKPVHFLDEALHISRIQRETLDAMLTVCYDNLNESRKAPMLMAKLIGKKSLDPWDMLAQSPVSGGKKDRSYTDALSLIQESFHSVDPEMGKFVQMMVDKRWIEGRVLPNKRTGAFCTGFPKSREPRVFMTYMGSNSDVSTLAHELGHAFHSWSVRDLPRSQTQFPMTLAETASIFAETILHDMLIERAPTKEEKIEFAWGELEGAASFLLNIPARFDFEKNFYEQRQKRSLSADELSELTDAAWLKWYGPSLAQNDKMFWATKLHFSKSGLSFYNFPYTFGYLFSLSIYARRAEFGADFMMKYIEILRDTGRMSAEDLVQKHLGEDIRHPDFWHKSIQIINKKIGAFEKLAF